jgi:hypothetical protein
MTIPQHPFRSH